jgi:uncharacterized membrane protein
MVSSVMAVIMIISGVIAFIIISGVIAFIGIISGIAHWRGTAARVTTPATTIMMIIMMMMIAAEARCGVGLRGAATELFCEHDVSLAIHITRLMSVAIHLLTRRR